VQRAAKLASVALVVERAGLLLGPSAIHPCPGPDFRLQCVDALQATAEEFSTRDAARADITGSAADRGHRRREQGRHADNLAKSIGSVPNHLCETPTVADSAAAAISPPIEA
jgi:hypothetical protein